MIMGMFDYVRVSYKLGEQFESQCQTKDIDPGLGGTMSQYWLCPAGNLFLIDYSQTADFIEFKEGDENYSKNIPLLNFQWVPNGKHGTVKAVEITQYIHVYPEEWKGDWYEWPECRIHLVKGNVKDFEVLTKGQRKY